MAEHDDATQAQLRTGHEVGAVARALLPDGVMIEAEPDLSAALATTRELLEDSGRPMFEATLQHDGVLVRIDVLEPDREGSWRLAEVKSSTGVKSYHLGDLATQLWVAHQAGLRISGAAIRHIQSSFVLEREGEFDGLFTDADLTAEIEPVAARRAEVVRAARATLASAEPLFSMAVVLAREHGVSTAVHDRNLA